ncbi:sodium:proton exchanger [Lysobacter alkalisoli]|uniref:Sodium:proton exchanger n=2 Tax=Marilutibacter alkalisoli TaxID=2591633 RepID=A0A514BUI7_9GAMM|nr:sodium:proton exchanger [Lysobacter alkalisoli]
MYNEITLLLFATAVLGVVALRLKQPVIVAYILIGIIAGPSVLDWVSANEPMELLAEIGVTILLFVVGLKLDIHLIRKLGVVALATGLGQLAFTIVLGFLIGLALDMDWLRALYVAVALTFSSTIIIVKLLSDKREIDSLHGRIAMGFLIVQDLAVVLAMMVIGTQGGASEGTTVLAQVGEILLKVAGLGVVVAILMRWVLPRVLHWMAASQELLLVFAVAWGTTLAAGGEWLGFSKEVGAFLAGFSLASLPFREAINARLASLRDFLLLFFFVHLGTQLDMNTLGAEVPAAILLSLFVLVGNPLIVMAIMGAMGYRKRTGFLAGLTVAQISEFSIIFIGMGVAVGHVDPAALGLVTLVGLITITLSTYMILYSHRLYALCEPWLGAFERANPWREKNYDEQHGRADVIVFGMGRYGLRLSERLCAAGLDVVGVDFDPEVLARARPGPIQVLFGDAGDDDFVAGLPLDRARQVVSSLRDPDLDRQLVHSLRRCGYEGPIAVTAHSSVEGKRLLEAGADEVLLPFHDAADHAARRIGDALQSRPAPRSLET